MKVSRKFILYSYGKKVREVEIQHGKKQRRISLRMLEYERLAGKMRMFDPTS